VQMRILTLTSEERFSQGFKMGGKLAIEMIYEDDSLRHTAASRMLEQDKVLQLYFSTSIHVLKEGWICIHTKI